MYRTTICYNKLRIGIGYDFMRLLQIILKNALVSPDADFEDLLRGISSSKKVWWCSDFYNHFINTLTRSWFRFLTLVLECGIAFSLGIQFSCEFLTGSSMQVRWSWKSEIDLSRNGHFKQKYYSVLAGKYLMIPPSPRTHTKTLNDSDSNFNK